MLIVLSQLRICSSSALLPCPRPHLCRLQQHGTPQSLLPTCHTRNHCAHAYTCQMPLHAWRQVQRNLLSTAPMPLRANIRRKRQCKCQHSVRDFGLQQGNTARGRHAAISAKTFTAHLLKLRFRLFCGEVTNGTLYLYTRTRTQHSPCATDGDRSLAGIRRLENTCNALIRNTDVRHTHGIS